MNTEAPIIPLPCLLDGLLKGICQAKIDPLVSAGKRYQAGLRFLEDFVRDLIRISKEDPESTLSMKQKTLLDKFLGGSKRTGTLSPILRRNIVMHCRLEKGYPMPNPIDFQFSDS